MILGKFRRMSFEWSREAGGRAKMVVGGGSQQKKQREVRDIVRILEPHNSFLSARINHLRIAEPGIHQISEESCKNI